MDTAQQSAVFLDRDGVIIANRADYVRSWADVRFLPGAFEALRRLARTAHRIVIVTNQSAVGRGIISPERAAALNRRIVAEIAAHGGRIDAVYLCPHHPAARCACRKPAPGLLLRAGRELGLDLARSCLVGDAASDLEAARAVGARGILVLTGRGREQVAQLAAGPAAGSPVAADLLATLDYLTPALAVER